MPVLLAQSGKAYTGIVLSEQRTETVATLPCDWFSAVLSICPSSSSRSLRGKIPSGQHLL